LIRVAAFLAPEEVKMAKKLLFTFAVLTCLLLAVTSVAAITNGEPDGEGHPYVGVVSNLTQTKFCSGIAISPAVFLTAVHCFDESDFTQGNIVLVTFDTSPGDVQAQDLYFGYYFPHPDYCDTCAKGLAGAYQNDIAVVYSLVNVLNEPPDLERYGALPAPGLVDTLPQKTAVTLVGYGYQNFIPGGGPPTPTFDQTRHVAWAELINSSQAYHEQFVKVSAAQGNGKGGPCFGDSGGPVLLGDSDIVVALNSYASNSMCAGVTYSSRVDTPSALTFINYFLP
jgi:secreted trypsin-like serine protease